MRLWFNRNFSSIHCVMDLLKQSDDFGVSAIIASHTLPDAAFFQKADEHYVEPEGLAGQAYVDWCVDFCLNKQIDVFWPGKEAVLIGEQVGRFLAVNTKVITVAETSVLDLLENKDRFYYDMQAKNILSPALLEFTDQASFLAGYKALRASFEILCVKPAVGVFGSGFRIIDEKRDSFTHMMSNKIHHINYNEFVLGLSKHNSIPKMLVMEYLGGAEWSVDCAALNGQLIGAIQRKKLIDKSHYQLIDNNQQIHDTVVQLAQDYQLSGIFNVQFKESERGICILEINARPSGGTGKACAIGVNLPALFLKHFMAGSTTQAVNADHADVQKQIESLKDRKVSETIEPYLMSF